MNEIVNTLAVFITGIFVGGAIVRYGIGLGWKMFYQSREDFPTLTYNEPKTEIPEYTGEEGEEE